MPKWLFVTLLITLPILFASIHPILFFVAPHQIVGLFLDSGLAENTAPLTLAASFLVIAALFQLFDGTQVTMSAALRGLSDTTMPLIIALVGYWLIGFPIAYYFGFHTPLRGVGVWIGLAAGLASVAFVLTIRFAMRERLHLTERAPV